MLTLPLLLSIIQVSSILDGLSPSMLSDLRTCMDKRSQNSQISCSNRIYKFLSAASLSIKEVYSLYEAESIAKISISKINGIQSGILQIFASSMKDSTTHPNRAMYGYLKREGKNCWCTYAANMNQFIQAASALPLTFYAVGTKGDPEEDNRITSYRLQYSLDGLEWIYYNESFVFTGNTDRNTEVLNNLNPFIARSVRLVPISWTGSICARVEFTVSKSVINPITPRSSKEILIPGVLTGLNFVSNSIFDPNCDHSRGYLNFRTSRYCQGFGPAIYDNDQWVIIAAYDFVWWHRISIQGREDPPIEEFTSSISVAYTVDGIVWTPYKDSKILTASYDKWSTMTIELDQFYAIAIKIFIMSYTRSPSGRFEAYYTRN